MSNFGKDMLDKIKSNKSKDASEIIVEQTKGTLTSSAIGLFVGLYIGYSRGYNMLFSGLVGALGGGLISKLFSSKTENK
jgi:outer membrane lipoprotein SlyB